MPAVLDKAGMGDVAEKLRGLGPVLSLQDAERACILLSQIREASEEAGDGWVELVSEAAFWAEGAIHSALNNESAIFQFCVGRVRMAMDSGFLLMRVH